MKYEDLAGYVPRDFGVEPGGAVGATPESVGATGSVESYTILEEVADGLAFVFFPPHLEISERKEGRGLLVVGSPGTSESDLMSVVSTVAGAVELGKGQRKWEVVQATVPLAGRFKSVSIPAGTGADNLRRLIWAWFKGELAGRGDPDPGAAMEEALGGLDSEEGGFTEIMAAFHRGFPGHGLLLLVENTPGAQPLTGTSRRHERCLAGLVNKTPRQQALVREYLRFFAPFCGDMGGRLEEFIAAFPLHPDYVEIVGRIKLTGKRPVGQTTADALRKLRAEAVPLNRPGLIAYDSYWEELQTNPSFRSIAEVDAVLESGKRAEQQFARSIADPALRELAVRLIHALCIHRLTRADIYSHEGVTAAELRDGLCLFDDSLAATPGDPREALLSRVKSVLAEMQSVLGSRLLCFDSRREEFYLHFSKFRRFVRPELVLHWVNAVPFLLLLATGGAMLASRFWLVAPGLFQGIVGLHKLLAACWGLLLPLTVLVRARVHWGHIREMLRWGKADLVWIVQSLRSLHNREAPISPAGRFNTGQKINACLVMLYFFGFGGSGLLMWFKGSILVPWYLHTALFFSAVGSVSGHLFLALLNPSTRISLAGIFHGWAPMHYVEHHHALSLPRSLRRHLGLHGGGTFVDELLASRRELTFLAVAIVLAGLNVAAFNNWKVESIKKKFAKSFSDCIKPSELSTKHRIGSTADSCTKCHSYTGEIPNGKCEECHGYIKERRANLVGYHGTLKGDCIGCHKEHPARSEIVVPLVREKFDHSLASFKRDGRHVQVACDECHKKKRSPEKTGVYYIGLKHEACTDCHRDPHGRQFAVACTTCHSPEGWTGKNLSFNHSRDSRFQLAGAHEGVSCAKCHKPASVGEPLGRARFRGLKTECADCHNDPHGGQFERACARCHATPAGWAKNLRFEHNRDAKFLLTGKHVLVDCIKCHQPPRAGGSLGSAKFKGLKMSCESCHKADHPPKYGPSCTSCHTVQSWPKTDPGFQHIFQIQFRGEHLSGKHLTAKCSACHDGARIRALGEGPHRQYDCFTCHRRDDPHKEVLGTECSKCHGMDGWKGTDLRFDHETMANFALDQDHRKVACAKCHENGRWKPLDSQCQSCHSKMFLERRK